VRSGVKADTGSGRRRSDGRYTILRIKQTNAAGSIYDLAKETRTTSPDRSSFIKQLNSTKTGKPNSRVMYPTVTKGVPFIMNEVNQILKEIENMYSAQIAADVQVRAGQSARAKNQLRDVLGRFGS
jgi:O-succinylbenzoate synthase